MTTDVTTLLAAVEEWRAGDPDPGTTAELAALASLAEAGDGDALAELANRFAGNLEFGTAGLRGAMAAGPNRMNRAVVIRAARGLIDYLTASLAAAAPAADGLGNAAASSDGAPAGLAPAAAPGPASSDGAPPTVVIGNDARLQSRQFALDTAAVVTAAGGRAWLLPDALPTPILAYAVRALGADAGVMVTASHNPAADNGYKVYLGGRLVADPERGVQIVPPHDSAIAAAIAAAPPAAAIARAESGWTDLGLDLCQRYIAAIAAPAPVGASPASVLASTAATGSPASTPVVFDPPPAAPLRIAYTAMHGVGGPIALDALARAGFDDVVTVAEQQEPDPAFPTVAFPNPEEPGAIDLALATARAAAADIVIANDPDADRCAVAVPDPRTGWRMLHGDELGSLLGEDAARSLAADPARAADAVFVNSIVSSRQLAAIARSHGVACQTTLTGFKWMGRVPNMAFAYEEAIGYCVRPDLVHDKDGLSTAVAVARLAARLKAAGLTLVDLLDELARRHGLYLTSQLSARFSDLAQIPATMAKLRRQPPAQLGGSLVRQQADLSEGYEGLPPTDGMLFLTDDDDRVVIRPSGTEPKVKCYLEVLRPVSPTASFDELTVLRAAARDRLEAIKSDVNEALFA
ncbi:MAG: phospho-sugar mutase [Propionibacteriaceae bacterium]|jgi:phosphomannomutase|nr:phospho-sugar mutase [Propionibacteriaceae bacterium]